MGLIFTPVLVRRLLLMPSSRVWAYHQHFLDSQLLQTVQLEGVTHLRLPTHPTPLLPAHPLIHAICDITVVVKKVCSKSSSVSQLLQIVTKHQPKDCSSYTANLAWLQSSTRESWWLQYFKSVFLEMSVVTIWSVFPNPVTYVLKMLLGLIQLLIFYIDIIKSDMQEKLKYGDRRSQKGLYHQLHI